MKPPPGCARSKPGQYWHLLCSLYGLKRSSRLWFDTLYTHLTAMSLKNSNSSPCLLFGTLIEDEPLFSVGIYVDNIVYFSARDAVERKFETLLSTNLIVSLTQHLSRH